MIEAIDAQIAPLERELRQLARRATGCRALMRLYGIGELTSLVTLCELGDVGRLAASRKAVRMAGRHISLRVLAGEDIKRIADECGTSTAMIHRYYMHELDVRHELLDGFSFDSAVQDARRSPCHLRAA
jgi:hypothetical protein